MFRYCKVILRARADCIHALRAKRSSDQFFPPAFIRQASLQLRATPPVPQRHDDVLTATGHRVDGG